MLDNWHSFARKLSDDYRVITVDQRNHGKSFHSDDFSYALLSQDLKQFLDHKGIKKCHLIGHSMGGKTVMRFQLEYPEMIHKSIIVDIAPKEYEGGHELIFHTLLDLDLDSIKSRKDATEKVHAKLQDQNVTLFLLKNLKRGANNTFEWKANIRALWNNYRHIKSSISSNNKIEAPTLFVKGSRSDYINQEDIELISEIYSDAEIETVQDSGHWVHAEKPQELLELSLSFLGNS